MRAEKDDDEEVARMAVEALRAAQRQAQESGHPYVVVIGDELVRNGPEGTTVLKRMPPSHKVTVRTKHIKS